MREMNPNKKGVLIFFTLANQMRFLSDKQRSDLFLAILDYGQTGVRPEFADKKLQMLWVSVEAQVDRDDEAYCVTSTGHKYSNYRKYSKAWQMYTVSREEWEDLGCPTALEIKKRMVRADPTGSKWLQMEFFYSIWNTETTTTTVPNSISPTVSVSVTALSGGGEPTRTREREPPPPADGYPTLEAVQAYCREQGFRYMDPVRFWHYYRANGWTFRSGRPVRDWKEACWMWENGDQASAMDGRRSGAVWSQAHPRATADEAERNAEIARYVRELHDARSGSRSGGKPVESCE